MNSVHDSFAGSGSPPLSWKTAGLASFENSISYSQSVVGTFSPSPSLTESSLTQCPLGVTSSISVSEIEDFSNPSSARVGIGLGVDVVGVNRSTGALAKVEKIVLGLWIASAWAVS